MENTTITNQKSSYIPIILCCVGLLLTPFIVYFITELVGRESLIRGRDDGVTYEILLSICMGFFVIISTFREITSLFYRIISAFVLCLLILPVALGLTLLQILFTDSDIFPIQRAYAWVVNRDIDMSVSVAFVLIIEIVGFTIIKRIFFKPHDVPTP